MKYLSDIKLREFVIDNAYVVIKCKYLNAEFDSDEMCTVVTIEDMDTDNKKDIDLCDLVEALQSGEEIFGCYVWSHEGVAGVIVRVVKPEYIMLDMEIAGIESITGGARSLRGVLSTITYIEGTVDASCRFINQLGCRRVYSEDTTIPVCVSEYILNIAETRNDFSKDMLSVYCHISYSGYFCYHLTQKGKVLLAKLRLLG